MTLASTHTYTPIKIVGLESAKRVLNYSPQEMQPRGAATTEHTLYSTYNSSVGLHTDSTLDGGTFYKGATPRWRVLGGECSEKQTVMGRPARQLSAPQERKGPTRVPPPMVNSREYEPKWSYVRREGTPNYKQAELSDMLVRPAACKMTKTTRSA